MTLETVCARLEDIARFCRVMELKRVGAQIETLQLDIEIDLRREADKAAAAQQTEQARVA